MGFFSMYFLENKKFVFLKLVFFFLLFICINSIVSKILRKFYLVFSIWPLYPSQL